MTVNRSASVLARLLALARRRGEDYNLLLNRFALERVLHRLSLSRYADQYLLKGALLFSLWYGEPHRPTRDADLLGFGPDDAAHLVAAFREIAAIVIDDGIAFDTGSFKAEPIREDNPYGGMRMRLNGRIGSARISLHIDVGFGDAVTPGPETVTFPTLLDDFAGPVLRVYPVYTLIAEKYHAMVVLGMANSRMKDFFDLAVIARRTRLDGALLARAIEATFTRRSTALPKEQPLALTGKFSGDNAKRLQWSAFLRKGRIAAVGLVETVDLLDRLLWPPTQVALAASAATATWAPEQMRWTA